MACHRPVDFQAFFVGILAAFVMDFTEYFNCGIGTAMCLACFLLIILTFFGQYRLYFP
jgi:hypothetical protein